MIFRSFHVAVALSLTLITAAQNTLADHWPAQRGPNGNGVSLQRSVPVEWSETVNVTWKSALPGAGSSSPIVWGDFVLVTASIQDGKRHALLCYDRADGTPIWQQSVPQPDDAPPSATPVTDGRGIYTWYGSAGLVASDFDGNPLWHRELGKVAASDKHLPSPVLHDDIVIQLVNAADGPFLIALNKHTGSLIWRTELGTAGSTATPIIVERDGQAQLIAALPGRLAGFNPQSGRQYWQCTGLGQTITASPMIEREHLAAVDTSGTSIGLRLPVAAGGDVTATHRLWRDEAGSQQIGSGVIVAGHVFRTDAAGTVRRYDARTGELTWKHMLNAPVTGDMVYVDAKLYVTDQSGSTHVISAGPKFEKLGTNPLGAHESVETTPAFSDGQVFIRTDAQLYCIGVRLMRN